MKLKLILFLFASLTYCASYGQDSIPAKEINQYNFKSKSNDQRVKRFLIFNKQAISILCHPLIASEIQDSLKLFYGGELDSVRIKNDYQTDSTLVCIKESYCWNVNNELPQIKNYKLLKKLIKNKSKLTDDEEKLLNYWIFYSNPRKEKVEKFIHYQSIVNNEKYLQVKYEITFDVESNYKVDIKEIRNNR